MRDALNIYKDEGCDGIIAIGGGSPMDLAKAVALMATHPGNSLQAYSFVEGGAGKITAAVAPIVAVADDVGHRQRGQPRRRHHHELRPQARDRQPAPDPTAGADRPRAYLSLPPHLTAGTGMDALTRNIECFLSNAFDPPADGIALDGLEKAWKYVERATRDGSDREARYHMAMAAMEGAMVFQKGLGAVHALSHPTGGLKGYRLHHGTLNAVYLPAVLRFNEPAVGEKYKRVAALMDLPEREAECGRRRRCRRGAERAARRIPKGLGAMGLQQDIVEKIADGAMATTVICRPRANRPRPSTSNSSSKAGAKSSGHAIRKSMRVIGEEE